MPQLILPDLKYKDSYIEAVKEYQAEDLPNYRGLDLEKLSSDFPGYLEQIQRESRGEGLPADYVPHTVFWLVEGSQYLGRVDIRHILNDFLHRQAGHIGYDVRPTQRRKGYGNLALKLGLEKAKELGIQEVLITCDVGNIGSNKIIRQNGGVLENTITIEDGKREKNRYWIKNEPDT